MSKDNPTKQMKAYALQEMTNLLRNMRTRPIDCYSQIIQGQGKQFFLGNNFVEDLIAALKKQYQ